MDRHPGISLQESLRTLDHASPQKYFPTLSEPHTEVEEIKFRVVKDVPNPAWICASHHHASIIVIIASRRSPTYDIFIWQPQKICQSVAP